MKSNKILLLVIGGISILLIFGMVMLILLYIRRPVPVPDSGNSESPARSATTTVPTLPTQPTQPPDAPYILGQWEGKLALFTPPDAYPRQVYDIYLSAFPIEEQRRLEAGIPAQNEVELAALLEDFTS